MSQEFELFDCDMYPPDDEPEAVCQCGAFHDDLEHAENVCGACGMQIIDIFGPAPVMQGKSLDDMRAAAFADAVVGIDFGGPDRNATYEVEVVDGVRRVKP